MVNCIWLLAWNRDDHLETVGQVFVNFLNIRDILLSLEIDEFWPNKILEKWLRKKKRHACRVIKIYGRNKKLQRP